MDQKGRKTYCFRIKKKKKWNPPHFPVLRTDQIRFVSWRHGEWWLTESLPISYVKIDYSSTKDPPKILSKEVKFFSVFSLWKKRMSVPTKLYSYSKNLNFDGRTLLLPFSDFCFRLNSPTILLFCLGLSDYYSQSTIYSVVFLIERRSKDQYTLLFYVNNVCYESQPRDSEWSTFVRLTISFFLWKCSVYTYFNWNVQPLFP